MSDQLKFKIYEWAEWLTKAVLVAICGLLWQMNLDITRSLHEIKNHGKEITELKAEVASIKQGYMSRTEVLEHLKRIELYMQTQVQQTEIARLKAEKDRP